MIVNELYNGSGLGNQLWRYTVTRAIALDNGYEFGIMNPHQFKALKIFDLDFDIIIPKKNNCNDKNIDSVQKELCH